MCEAEVTSIFEMQPDEAHEARLDAEAEAAIAAGQLVPHEKVRVWLTKLANGEITEPPKP